MTSSPFPDAGGSAEIARIRNEYARRDREISRDVYGWGRAVNRYYHCQIYRHSVAALAREGLFPLDDLAVADIGCGRGSWLLEFAQWGARARNLAGIDLAPDRVEEARQRLPGVDLRAGDARNTGWASSSFDIVSQFTVFTSVLDAAVKQALAAEMLRLVRPSGVILWLDFRFSDPANPHTRGIGREEIRRLFPKCTVRLRSLILAPPIARRVVNLSWMLALALEKIPCLRTHYLAIIRKP